MTMTNPALINQYWTPAEMLVRIIQCNMISNDETAAGPNEALPARLMGHHGPGVRIPMVGAEQDGERAKVYNHYTGKVLYIDQDATIIDENGGVQPNDNIENAAGWAEMMIN